MTINLSSLEQIKIVIVDLHTAEKCLEQQSHSTHCFFEMAIQLAHIISMSRRKKGKQGVRIAFNSFFVCGIHGDKCMLDVG